MIVRVTLSVMGNDRSYVGTVSRECTGEGLAKVLAELDTCYAEISTSPMFELVIGKGELHDALAGVPADKLAEGVAALAAYKERISATQQQQEEGDGAGSTP